MYLSATVDPLRLAGDGRPQSGGSVHLCQGVSNRLLRTTEPENCLHEDHTGQFKKYLVDREAYLQLVTYIQDIQQTLQKFNSPLS